MLATFEAALLRLAPIYHGLGSPLGDGSAVVVIPGFLGTDGWMAEIYAWLHRLNYRPCFSGIGLNADCPHILIRSQLTKVLEQARRETGRKVHLIGHSLGGLKALSLAAQRPDAVASVVAGTHIGLIFNPTVYKAIADRLAAAQETRAATNGRPRVA
ncbi:MAG: alpha/beta hydrolase-fold protein [Bryobacteraceae bacterium]|nr:alpha/beta hydrolase-fold protein [Bryobacteraceae bacterium]